MVKVMTRKNKTVVKLGKFPKIVTAFWETYNQYMFLKSFNPLLEEALSAILISESRFKSIAAYMPFRIFLKSSAQSRILVILQ